MDSGLRPAKYPTNITAAQHVGANNDVELFATVLRRYSDGHNAIHFIVEDWFRVLNFVRL